MAENKITLLIESILNPKGFTETEKQTLKLEQSIDRTKRSVLMSNLGMMFGFKMISSTISNFFRDALTTYNELTNYSGALGMATIELESNFKLLQVELISAFGPTLAMIVDWLANLALWIANIDPAVLNVVVGALVAIGAITGIAAVAASLNVLAGSINSFIKGKDNLHALKDTLDKLDETNFEKLKKAISGLPEKFTDAFDTLKSTIFSSDWWGEKWDAFKTVTKDVWEGLFGEGGTIPTLIDKGKEVFEGLVTKIQELSPLAQLAIIGGIAFAIGFTLGKIADANVALYDFIQNCIKLMGIVGLLMLTVSGMEGLGAKILFGAGIAQLGLIAAVPGGRESVVKKQQEAEKSMIEMRAIQALTAPGLQEGESQITKFVPDEKSMCSADYYAERGKKVTYNTYSEGAINIEVRSDLSNDEILRTIHQAIFGSEGG